MKIFNLDSRLARGATATLALGLLLGAQNAIACTVDNWNGGNSENITAGGPDIGLARYSGLCAMETPASTAAWVQDNSPGGINRIRARLYVLNELASGQSAVIYRGFSTDTGTGPLFTVRLATDGTVRLIDNATAAEVQQTSSTNWVSVEIDWSQGSGNGTISLSINGQTPAANNALNNTGSSLQSVRLGNLLGAAGSLNFDAYESRRTTEIGRLIRGDADANGSVGGGDISAIIDEFLNGNLAEGQPDCDENGNIGAGDISCIIQIFLGA